MKIAIVFDAFGYGGAENVGVNYVRMMKEMGHEVTVINLTPKSNQMCSRLPEDVKYRSCSFSQYLCADYYYILVKAFWWGKYVFPLMYLILTIVGAVHSFFKRLQFGHFDLAIAFAGHINDMNFVGRGFLKSSRKICWFHGAIFQKFLYSDAYVSLCKRMDEVIVLNEECQEQTFVANHYMPRFKIRKLYNPIYLSTSDINDEKVNQIRRKYGEFIVMSARLTYPHKDHYTVIAALGLLHKKYHRELNLVLLGDGPEKEKLQKFCIEHNVDENVFFVGSVDNVQDYYKAAFTLVHASVAGEGLPTVILEAMACGTPVVATDSTVGPKEIIGNNEYGLLCKVKDPEDMAKAVNELYEDEGLRNHYVEKGQERLKAFLPDFIEQEFETVLHQFEL